MGVCRDRIPTATDGSGALGSSSSTGTRQPDSESHVALANLDLYYDWNFAEAEEEARRAVAIDPNSPRALQASCAIQINIETHPGGSGGLSQSGGS